MRLSSRVPMVTASGCPLCVTGRTIAGTTPMRGHAVRTCYSAIIATCTNIVYDGFARSIVGASIPVAFAAFKFLFVFSEHSFVFCVE